MTPPRLVGVSPCVSNLELSCKGATELEELSSLSGLFNAYLTNDLSNLGGLSGYLSLIVNKSAEHVVPIRTMTIPTGLKLLVNQGDPLLTGQGPSGLEEGVQGCMFRADIEDTSVHAHEVATLRGVAYSFPEGLEGGCLIEEGFG